jgi:uncharacterized Tic20 family protein
MKSMDEKLNSDHKLMSIFSHLAILIPNIGIVAPIFIWLTQREKSKFIRFHAMQAIFFQMLFFLLLMLSIFIGIILMAVAIMLANNSGSEPGVFFWISMGIVNFYFPLWFIFSIYAIVASVKSFRGKRFKYWIIGRIIEKRIYE